MRKRIKCKKKSGSQMPTLVQTVLVATALLNLLNTTMNLAITILKMLELV